MAVARLVDLFSYPLLLFFFWRIVQKRHGDRAAFFSLCILSSAYSVVLAATTLQAFNLAFIWMILALDALEDERVISAGIYSGMAFYTHTMVGWCLVLYCVIRAALRDPRSAAMIRSVGVGLVLALPLLYWQWISRDFFELVRVKESRLIEWDLGIYLASCVAIFLCVVKKDRRYMLPLMMWLSLVPLLFGRPVRFIYGHGLVAGAWLAGLLLDSAWDAGSKNEKFRKAIAPFIFGALLIFFFVAPVLRIEQGKPTALRWFDRTAMRYLLPPDRHQNDAKGFSIYFPDHYEKMVRIIKDNSVSGDIVWTDFSYCAGILSILSDRATSCAMLAEVRSQKSSNHLMDAKIIVWFKDKHAKASADMLEAVQRHGFRLLQEEPMAYIYLNPHATAQTQHPVKPLIPSWLVFGLFGGLLSIAIASGKK